MQAKQGYLALAIVGAIVPLVPFVPWLSEHGLDVRLLVQELFANRVSTFFGLDVVISAIVVIAFAWIERDRLSMRSWWLPVVGVVCVGVSFALPLLLFMRERELSGQGSKNKK
jgi:uncharacterized protein DUF2834